MDSEFIRITLGCDGDYTIPSTPGRRSEPGAYSIRHYSWPGHGGWSFLHRRWMLSEYPRFVKAKLPRVLHPQAIRRRHEGGLLQRRRFTFCLGRNDPKPLDKMSLVTDGKHEVTGENPRIDAPRVGKEVMTLVRIGCF